MLVGITPPFPPTSWALCHSASRDCRLLRNNKGARTIARGSVAGSPEAVVFSIFRRAIEDGRSTSINKALQLHIT